MDPPPQATEVNDPITLSKDQLKGTCAGFIRGNVRAERETTAPGEIFIVFRGGKNRWCLLQVLRKAFDTFDTEKNGRITCDNINTILDMLGHATDAGTVRNIVAEIDHQGTLISSCVCIHWGIPPLGARLVFSTDVVQSPFECDQHTRDEGAGNERRKRARIS